MLSKLGKAIRFTAGIWFAFSGAVLVGAAVPVATAGGDGLIAVMFLPVGAGLFWLGHRWVGRWAWGIAAVFVGWEGVGLGLRGIVSQGIDAGSAPHIAGWLTALAAIPLAYLALRGLRRPKAEPPAPPALP